MQQTQKGFSAVITVLIIVIIGTVAAVGYKLARADAGQEQTRTETNKAEVKTAPTPAPKATMEVATKEYRNTEFGFSFQYPATWKYTADFRYTGRGANEGEVSVTSPSGAIVTFRANLGGKGGGCGDPNPADVPHRTAICSTREILKITQIQPAGTKAYPINLYHYKFTPGGENAQSEYGMFVDSGEYAPTTTGPTIGAIFPFSIMQGTKGNIESHTSGGTRTSSDYFTSPQAKHTEQVLKSFRLL